MRYKCYQFVYHLITLRITEADAVMNSNDHLVLSYYHKFSVKRKVLRKTEGKHCPLRRGGGGGGGVF